jgi:nicotinate-nucleotide adenylyltransferase
VAGRVGLLTGTFDPIHLGHVALARGARDKFDLDEVVFWVNAEAGHKVGVTPYKDRVAMVRLALVGEKHLRSYDGELAKRPHVISSFMALAQEFAPHELAYIVGADTFETIDRWDFVESVVRSGTFLIAKRPGAAESVVADVKTRLGELGRYLKAESFEFAGYTQASSRKIREEVARGGRPEALEPSVYDYIVTHDLYR